MSFKAYNIRSTVAPAPGVAGPFSVDLARLGHGSQGNTHMRFDGVNQYAINTDGVGPGVFPNSPGPATTATILWWVRGTDAAVAAPVRTYAAFRSASAIYDAYAAGYFRPDAPNWRILSNRLRTIPSAQVNGRVLYQTSWTGGTMADPSTWRLMAQTITATKHNFYAKGGFVPNATDSTVVDYNNEIGKYFTINASVSGAGALVAGTTMPLDYYAPAVYGTVLTEAQIQAIETAGPTFDHAANGATGWWPGNGAIYPTIVNRGSVGSAWDLTLNNGSQAMIMEDI